jgi:hypothetical protein
MKAKSIKAWAVFDEGGRVIFKSVMPQRKLSILEARVYLVWGKRRSIPSWAELILSGYTVRPITITEGH